MYAQVAEPVGLGLAVEAGRACFVPLAAAEGGGRLAAGAVAEALRGVLADGGVLKVRAQPCACLYIPYIYIYNIYMACSRCARSNVHADARILLLPASFYCPARRGRHIYIYNTIYIYIYIYIYNIRRGARQIGHDVKYALGVLGRYLPGAEAAPIDDTMMLSFVLDAGAQLCIYIYIYIYIYIILPSLHLRPLPST